MTELEAHARMVTGYGRGKPACPYRGQPWRRQAPGHGWKQQQGNSRRSDTPPPAMATEVAQWQPGRVLR